jgi:serine/threonine protein kinase
MTVRIGQLLGEYRLVRFLGKGSYAEVFLGEHRYIGTKDAIKVLHTRLIDQEESFIKEARQIANLSHPNIVRVRNFAIDRQGDQPIPYLVMDYAPKGNILQLHPRGERLTPQQILLYIKQIANALDYAHEHQLVHRDVKPENILVGQDNTLLLSDFGIAVVIQQENEENSVPAAGTKAYIAPEQILGDPRPQSDQYALGIIVYEWLCGFPPFSIKDKPTTAILEEHLYREPPSLNSTGINVSQKVEEVMKRVLAKDPKQRFATVSEFAWELDMAFQEMPPSFTLPPPHNENAPDPNSLTFEKSSGLNIPPSRTDSPQSWAAQGMVPPPATPQPLAGKKRQKGNSASILKLNWGYFYARQWIAFRVACLLLTIVSAWLVSLILQSSFPWILLLLALLFFICCVLFSNRKAALTSALLFACYWVFVGVVIDANVLHANELVIGILVFCISLALFVWYALSKTP